MLLIIVSHDGCGGVGVNNERHQLCRYRTTTADEVVTLSLLALLFNQMFYLASIIFRLRLIWGRRADKAMREMSSAAFDMSN